MLQKAQDYFKRHPKAKVCHVVLTSTFDNQASAKAFQRAMNAHGITSYTRKEYEDFLKTNSKPSVDTETNQ